METNTHPTSLAEAKAMLAAKLDEGTVCPCCQQYAKRYRRPLTGAMAYALVIVARHQTHLERVRKTPDVWVHVENLLKDTPGIPSSIRGDFAKLVHWGFVEKASGKRADGSPRNGHYAVTPAGFEFVGGGITAPSHILIYNNNFEGFDGTEVTIKDVIGKHFDYSEVMQRYALPANPQPSKPLTLFDLPPKPSERSYH